MKIQCDVCNQKEAVVYCSADEAALCAACDQRVHHANKLAGKHPRFNLLNPTVKDSPVCDICQEKKALLFCQQDRALLCKDCDVAIHKVNQFTQNHCRFLLTGVKVSLTCDLYSSSTATTTTTTTTTTNVSVTKNAIVPDHKLLPSQIMNQESSNGSGNGSGTSSISEYLIETLPGWHVEDFLDSPPTFTKVVDNDLGSIWGDDLLDGSFNNSFSSEPMGIWVPQAPLPDQPYTHVYPRFEPGSNMGFGDQSLSFAYNGHNNLNNNKITKGTKTSRKRTFDNGNCFTVPQISPSSMSSKRSSTLWH